MTPKQWERVKQLFQTTLECAPPQRTAFLQQNEHDEVVRSEVHRLVRLQDRLNSFLSSPPFVDPQRTSANPPDRLAPGEVLAGRFRIVNFIAAGGMGEVYKAADTRLDRLVALKFLPRELAEDCESLERLHREAKAASSLNHPYICTIYDFGEDAGRAFISMEYLEGETLATRLKNGLFPVAETLDVALQIASALSAAHKKGIIHRDLKPGNIMLTGAGPKLLDFGLAKHERPAPLPDETVTALTTEARVVGTLPYMSPEQLKGLEVDARGDIFAFGAVLYEMLTAIRAFQRRSSSETIIAIDCENPLPLRSLVEDVPEPLERIVYRCLQKQPEKRFSSVEEIEHALAALRSETLYETRGFNTKLLARKLKSPRMAVPFAALLLLLISGSAWWVHHSLKVRWARETALPRISDLIAEDKTAEAYSLAVQAECYIPQNPALQKT